jgi:hypothetical protein
MCRRARTAVVTAAAAIFFCVGLIGAAHSEDKITLRYGQIANSARSISSIALAVALRLGFLEREGIDLEVVGLRGTRYQIEELDKGNVDISHTATPYLIQAVLNGSNSVGIVGAAANTIYSLIAQPQIRLSPSPTCAASWSGCRCRSTPSRSQAACSWRGTGCRRAPTAARSWWARRCAPIA